MCVPQIPLRNPALLAKQALTIDHISNGRLELGLPVDPACEMMGLPNWDNKERAARFREYVTIIDRLLTNPVTTFKGQYYEVNQAAMDPPPVQAPRPPIVVAAMGPTMIRRAVEFADNWNSTSPAMTFDGQVQETRDRVRQVDEHCARIGRDPSSLRRSYLMLDPLIARNGGFIDYYGSADTFADRMRALIALGISEIGVIYPQRTEQVATFEKIAAEVIPALKAGQ
jgi:alkanesulfonate monooxygenase SsuD/methylene tetrahydromethanopterin reductase-like flavin-dependent oxidoreductase (luciferase family)